MLLIVDANCASKALCAEPTPDFAPILSALLLGKRKLALGGSKQREEYRKLTSVWRLIRVLDQAGRTRLTSDVAVEHEEALIKLSLQMTSDDPHIIALARITGTRLLCSHDQALHADFCNPRILSKPRGKVYQNAGHAHLLK